jgi:hypothetical protein
MCTEHFKEMHGILEKGDAARALKQLDDAARRHVRGLARGAVREPSAGCADR